jgi:transposase
MKACPKCLSCEYTKDGIVGGRQRYKCKSCHYRYTVNQRGFGSDIKRQAIVLYLQGLDFRSIGRILHCSHVIVHNWIKSYGKGIEQIRSEAGVDWVDEIELKKRITANKENSQTALLLIDINDNTSTALCVTELDLKVIDDKTLDKRKK